MQPKPETKPRAPLQVRGPDIRRDYAAVRAAQDLFAGLMPESTFEDCEIQTAAGPIKARRFRPEEQRNKRVLLFFHGGGWVIGSLDSYNRVCATMAELTGSVVWSIDYRLAPEHPFPAGLDDALAVTQAVMNNPQLVDAAAPEDVILIGDSAGANLAAVVALELRNRQLPSPGAQILFYPAVQTDHSPESEFESVREHAKRWFPRAEDLAGFIELYAPDDQDDWRVAPLHAPDHSGLPRTLIITAAWDPLRDEGEAYGRRLAAAGNDVQVERIDRALHGFLSLPRRARPVQTSYTIVEKFLASPEGTT